MGQHLINWGLAIVVALLLGFSGGVKAATQPLPEETAAKMLTGACMMGSIQTNLDRGVNSDEILVMTSVSVCAPILLDFYQKLPNPPSKERQAKGLIDQGLAVLRNLRHGRTPM